ncbi:hypothetical protein ACFRK5_08655 [Streptomyces niveus]|uniref:hypothetical protein n=1 Tax=Streptomyces niveus TaxID=193462 RepID=UPI0036C58D3E
MARAGCAVGMCVVLAGCTADGSGEPRESASAKKEGASATASPSPSPSEVVDISPARLPNTRAQATVLIRDVLPGPADFGPGAVRRTPYESDPRRWPVLGEDCVWEQRALPKDVLATLTRSYEIPASGDRGPLRLSAVVTVHRTAEQADWENAEVLEEMMRCPEQMLRSDEFITDLRSVPASFGESGNEFAEDSLTELGSYTSTAEGRGEVNPYIWEQTRIGQFTLAVSAKGAGGWSQADLFDRLRDPHVGMRSRLRGAIERDPSEPSGDTKDSTKSDTKDGAEDDTRDGRR